MNSPLARLGGGLFFIFSLSTNAFCFTPSKLNQLLLDPSQIQPNSVGNVQLISDESSCFKISGGDVSCANGAVTISTLTAISSITASAFFGDGSHLTGIATPSPWVSSGGVTSLTLPSNNVLIASTLTVQGGSFSVGKSSFVVSGGSVTVANQLNAMTLSISSDIYANGKLQNDYSLYFNGGGGTITHRTALNPADMTIEYYFLGTVGGGNTANFQKTVSKCAQCANGWYMQQLNDSIFFEWSNNKAITGSVNIHDGKWHHIAATHNGTSTTMRLFVDGQPQGTNTSNVVANTIAPIVIGGPPGPIAAQIGNVRYSDFERYVTTFTPGNPVSVDSHTIFLLKMNEGQGTTSYATNMIDNLAIASYPVTSWQWGTSLPIEQDPQYQSGIANYYTKAQANSTFLQTWYAAQGNRPGATMTEVPTVGSVRTLLNQDQDFDSSSGGFPGITNGLFTAIYAGTFAANAHNKRLEVEFDDQDGGCSDNLPLYDSGSVAENGGSWRIKVEVIGTISTTVKTIVTATTSSGLMTKVQYATGGGFDDSDCTPNLNLQGTGTADGDIKLEFAFFPMWNVSGPP